MDAKNKIWLENKEIETTKYQIVSTVEAISATRGEAGRSGHLNLLYSPDMKGQDDEGYVVINAIGNKQWVDKETFENIINWKG